MWTQIDIYCILNVTSLRSSLCPDKVPSPKSQPRMSCSPCSKLLLQNGKLFKDQVMLQLLFKSRFLTMASELSVSWNHLSPKSSCHLLVLLDYSWPHSFSSASLPLFCLQQPKLIFVSQPVTYCSYCLDHLHLFLLALPRLPSPLLHISAQRNCFPSSPFKKIPHPGPSASH